MAENVAAMTDEQFMAYLQRLNDSAIESLGKVLTPKMKEARLKEIHRRGGRGPA